MDIIISDLKLIKIYLLSVKGQCCKEEGAIHIMYWMSYLLYLEIYSDRPKSSGLEAIFFLIQHI